MDAEKAVMLANQYGISTVLCMMVIGLLTWVLKWVFDTSKERERAMAHIINVGLANLTTSMNELAKSLNVNSAAIASLQMEFKEVSRYQREEHDKIMRKIDDGERAADSAREKILNAIQDGECRAT